MRGTLLLTRPPPHRDLHSFPTRRSSDLLKIVTAPGLTGHIFLVDQVGKLWVVRLSDNHRTLYHDRSEEHTSELQSPDHLVCRLLLEKKNNQPTTFFPTVIDIMRTSILNP